MKLEEMSVEELRHKAMLISYDDIRPIHAFDEVVRRLKAAQQLKQIGWIYELADGQIVFTEGDLDPKEVHDNGRPTHRVYIKVSDER